MTHGLLIHAEDVPRPRMWLILGQPVGSDKRPLRVLTGCRVCSCFCKYNVLYIFMVNEKSLGKKRCVPSREALAEIHLVHVLGSILSLKCSVV